MSELLPELGQIGIDEEDITVRIRWDGDRVTIVGVNGRDAHNSPATYGTDEISRPKRFGLTVPPHVRSKAERELAEQKERSSDLLRRYDEATLELERLLTLRGALRNLRAAIKKAVRS